MEADNRSLFLLLSFPTHSVTHSPSIRVGCCLLSAEAGHACDIMTAAIVHRNQDGPFIMDWHSYWCAPLTSIGRADVTFSWLSPCWLSWERRQWQRLTGLRGVSRGQRRTWPLAWMWPRLCLSFVAGPPWWIILLCCVRGVSSLCWNWESIMKCHRPCRHLRDFCEPLLRCQRKMNRILIRGL